MKEPETIKSTIVPFEGSADVVDFHWDFETEILAGAIPNVPRPPGTSLTIELGGVQGSFVSLDLANGVLAGIEIVVWPRTETVAELVSPRANLHGRLALSTPQADPSSGLVELGVPLGCEQNADGSVIRLLVGEPRRVEAVALAENFFAEVDANQQLAGFWLTGVPPFPNWEEQK